ncbi:tyrosine-type recombinase/integrase [Jonquetella anthropi]|uniref:tyrosine-type recombinase/integrase n=1 Tax=Jonquetella anthropi TaxID=428712 RepID=UPI0023F20BF7|nr:tyrosine-type recombinase/integrase [Jonquetella anthropi]
MELDGDGLYLRIRATGRKTWIVRYWHGGKERRLTIGDYPAVSLATARTRRDEIKARVRSGLPVQALPDKLQFEAVAYEWLNLKKRNWVPKYARTVTYRIEHYILPSVGSIPIGTITRQCATDFLLALARRGVVVTAKHCAELLTAIADYAIERGYVDHHPLQNLYKVLPKHTQKHFTHTIRPDDFGKLLRAIDGVHSYIKRAALRVTAYCFVRVGELLSSKWEEMDLENALWTIPAEHTKRRREHIVPLARQVVAILRELKKCELETVYANVNNIPGRYVFPSKRPRISTNTSITESAMLRALKVMCWDAAKNGEAMPATTLHGFRHTASTFLHDRGENTLWIEKQLAHLDPNKIRAVYNSAEYLDERRGMMQRYADFLDSLKSKK